MSSVSSGQHMALTFLRKQLCPPGLFRADHWEAFAIEYMLAVVRKSFSRG